MGRSSRIQGGMIAAVAALLVVAAIGVDRGKASRVAPAGSGSGSGAGALTGTGTLAGEKTGGALVTFGWGKGPGQIGLAEEDEAHGETSLRLATGGGAIALLDDENHRVLRLGKSDVRLSARARARDVAVATDGSLLVLEGEGKDSRVAIFASDGKPRGELAIDEAVAAKSRGVIVSGNDVFVESHRGEITRIGDLAGTRDPASPEVPGLPTRDGRGWLTARIPNARTGTLHVYVVEKGSEAQRFSREMRPGLFVEGIPVVDTDASGTIYVVATGTREGAPAAVLVCVEPENGEVIGTVDLATETILDGKALDEGGIVTSVFTKDGIRVARHACP